MDSKRAGIYQGSRATGRNLEKFRDSSNSRRPSSRLRDTNRQRLPRIRCTMTILIGEWDNNVAVPTKGRGYKVPLFSREELLVLEILQEAMFKRILYLC